MGEIEVFLCAFPKPLERQSHRLRFGEATKKFHILMKKHLLFLTLLALSFWGCTSNDEDAPTEATGKLVVEVAHTANGQPLLLDGTLYENSLGQRFSVEEFKFYLSNLKLRNTENNTLFQEQNSYHLVNAARDGSAYALELEVPVGTYHDLEMAIGVDNGANTSLDNLGDLSPSNNMAWDWNTGYKFVLLEGRYPQPDGTDKGVVFHIGTDQNYYIYKLRQSSLQQPLTFRKGETVRVRLNAEITQLFAQPHTIDFDEVNEAMFGPNADKVGENYRQGFLNFEGLD